jgi:hypothetical protein
LIDEPVSTRAAMVDEILVGFEDVVREPVVAQNCQTFSTGSSGQM